MPEAGVEGLAPVGVALLVVGAPALLWVFVRNHKAREVVGEPLAVVRPKRVRVLRAFVPAALLLALFAWCAAGAEPNTRYDDFYASFEGLALVVLVAWLAPARGDRVLGRDGVQLGARARRWSELVDPKLEGGALAFGPAGARERVELSPALLIAAREVLGGG